MSGLSTSSGNVHGGGGGSGRSAFQEQVVNPPPTGGDAAAFAANAKAQIEDYATGTYSDSDLVVENNGVKNLAPRSAMRWVAVQDGDWSNPSTWYDTTDADQTVPDVAGQSVLIPQGITVTYDVADGTQIDMAKVRIDGALEFDTTADRSWNHEYTFVDHTGKFECGSSTSAVPANVTIKFNIDCSSDMDFANDRMKLGRGFVCFDGEVSIFGADKVPFTRVPVDPAVAPRANDTSITLDRQVVGGAVGDWEVGDTILITGTRLKGWDGSPAAGGIWEQSETEERTIASIDNSVPAAPVVTLDSALNHDHLPSLYGYELDYDNLVSSFTVGATLNGSSAVIIGVDDNGGGTGKLILKGYPGPISDNATLTDSAGGSATANGTVSNTATCHVANKTRNIQFEPVNLADKAQFWKRPHILLKGRGTIDLSWVSVRFYGRTDQNQNEMHVGNTYAFGDYVRGKSGYGAWNGPGLMSARFLDFDAKTADFDLADLDRQNKAYNETVTSSSGGSAKIGDIQDNGDGTGTLLLLAPSGTFADNDIITSSKGASCSQNGVLRMVPTTAKTVFQGRYPLHMHRSGPDNPQSATVNFLGCVVYDAPAWAYVHHDSHANIDRCIAHYFRSAGFAAEGGGNIGLWSDNLATDQYEPWLQYGFALQKNGGTEFGASGHGYWLNSRSLRLVRNVASNVVAGILWTTRVSSAHGTQVYPGSVSDGRIFYGLAASPSTTVDKAFSVIEQFEDCESYACFWGGGVAKNQPNQHHDKRSLLLRFKAWEVSKAFVSQYTAHYTLKDFECHGIDTAARGGAGPNYGESCITQWRKNVDMVVSNGDFRGFSWGLQYSGSGTAVTAARKSHFVIEPKFREVALPYVWDGNGKEIVDLENTNWSNEGVHDDLFYLRNDEVGPIGASFTGDIDQMVWDGGARFCLIGTVTDSLGSKLRNAGVASDTNVVGEWVVAQSEVQSANKVTAHYGVITLLYDIQLEALMQQEGVYSSNAGDKVLLIPDLIGDRFDGTSSYFSVPVALRMPVNQFNKIAPADNGPLDDGPGGAWDGFNPAGTPGLT